MSQTTHYGLYLTDSDQENFIDWRNEINGQTNSNMTKIDAAIAGRAAPSTVINATLLASGWVGVESPYRQTITVNGLGDSTTGTISMTLGSSAAVRAAVMAANMDVESQQNDTLTIIAMGSKPSIDIPVTVVLED